jgi:protein SCO1
MAQGAALPPTDVGRLANAYRGGIVAPPLPKPEFVLTDTSGAHFDFWNETQGFVTLLFFGYTSCPDECPTHMANLGSALKSLPAVEADQIKFVFVTTDPPRDTSAKLRRWLDNFDKKFVGLTGSQADIEASQKAARVSVAYRIGTLSGNSPVAHANFVIAYTKDNLAHVIYPGGISKGDWMHDLPMLIKESWPSR